MPEPVLLNTWKHHAGALRGRIAEAAAAGSAGLGELATRLVVLGTELMDLYTGTLTPVGIGERVIAALRAERRLGPAAYAAWLAECGGYGVIEFPEDQSRWVLRLGAEGGRYVHAHPGRWSPATRRVRANVLKTAVLANAYAAVHGGDPADVKLVNEVRRLYLQLSPMRAVEGDQGLAPVIAVLRPDGA